MWPKANIASHRDKTGVRAGAQRTTWAHAPHKLTQQKTANCSPNTTHYIACGHVYGIEWVS